MSDEHSPLTSPLPRREFIRLAGLGTGAVLAGGMPGIATPDEASEFEVRRTSGAVYDAYAAATPAWLPHLNMLFGSGEHERS